MKLRFSGLIMVIVIFTANVFAQNTKDQTKIENINLEFKTPSGQNGLVEVAFRVNVLITMSRGMMSDKRTFLYFKIIAEASTSDNPLPTFNYNYRYNGNQYGNQHVGYDAFQGIKAIGPIFNVIVQGPNLNWEGTADNIFDKKIPVELPNDADARDYSIHLTIKSVSNFQGTETIINKIREILKRKEQEEQEKEKLTKAATLKSEADKLIAAGDYQGAKNKLQNAKQLTPEDNSLDEHIKKVEQKEAESLAQKEKETENKKTTSSGTASPKSSGSSNSGTSSTVKAAPTENDFWGTEKSQTNTPAKQKTDEELLAEYQETQRKNEEARQQQAEEFNRKLEKRSELADKSFYAATALDAVRNNLNEATTLSSDHNNIEEMEAEFESNYQKITQLINEETASMNEKLKAEVDFTFQDGTANDKAIGDVVVAAGALINSLTEEKRKREAEEKLERNREIMKKEFELKRSAMLAEIAAKRRTMILDFRQNFQSVFKDGGVPLSNFKVSQNVLYFFSYHIVESTMQNDSPRICLSNVFPVARYNDGSWPFKTSIVSELAQKANGKVVLMGYYGTEALAIQTRNAFISMAEKCEYKLENTFYKGKNSTGTQGSTDDFWEQNKVKSAPEQKEQKKDDFWDK